MKISNSIAPHTTIDSDYDAQIGAGAPGLDTDYDAQIGEGMPASPGSLQSSIIASPELQRMADEQQQAITGMMQAYQAATKGVVNSIAGESSSAPPDHAFMIRV